MRLYLLPISTRRTLLYCQRLENAVAPEHQTPLVKLQDRVAKMWASWESKDSGWQKHVVHYGNRALRRIPFEEWGLKSVPSLSSAERRRLSGDQGSAALSKGSEKLGSDVVDVIFPASLILSDRVHALLARLATERDALHRRRLLWCLVGMPISAPFGLVPIIPNIPFFFLAYRAWSHWRAISGGKHILFLLQNDLLNLQPSSLLDEVYRTPKAAVLPSSDLTDLSMGRSWREDLPWTVDNRHAEEGEQLLLTQERRKHLTHVMAMPQLELELERAIFQVELAIERKKKADARRVDRP